MTPLSRWVFLVPLLGLVASLPAHLRDDACVRLCRAQAGSEDHGGGCSHERRVLQSGSDRSLARRLLCLTLCRDPEDRPVFDDSRACVDLRRALIAARGCSCSYRTKELEPRWSFAEYDEGQPAIDWLDEALVRDLGLGPSRRTGASSRQDLEERSSSRMELADTKNVLKVEGLWRFENALAPSLVVKEDNGPPGGTVVVPGVKEIEGLETQEEEVEVVNEGTHGEATTKDPNSSEEGHIDWEMWCMAQCDNGQGGSACNCDIIP